MEADIYRIARKAGITPPEADDMEMWMIAAAAGLDLIETMEDKFVRETNEQNEWVRQAQAERARTRQAAKADQEASGR